MFPLPFTPPRPTTPTTTTLPPTAPILNTLYASLLRPTLLPPPPAFTQPLLDQFVENHDPLLENQSIFTAGGRLREVGVAVEGIGREFRRRGEEAGGAQEGVKLEVVREGRLRCRLANVRSFSTSRYTRYYILSEVQQMGSGNRSEKEKIIAGAKERMETFEKEMKREEEEALKIFKEGLRRAVGGG